MTEGIAATKESHKSTGPIDNPTAANALEGERRRQDAERHPAVGSKKSGSEKVNVKSGKAKATKKMATKAERVHRRRKRNVGEEKKDAGISQASAKMLFQCSCQLLRTQTLDYDVRARELEERNAKQTKEIEEWEKKIRSLQRELEEYSDEQSDSWRDETAGVALLEAAAGESNEQANALPTMDAAAAVTDPSLPPAVVAAETKLQEELRKRSEKLKEFCKSVPGFIDSLDDQTPSPF